MQFVNSTLYKLAKNLTDEDFKYSLEELGYKSLELLKQKGDYSYEYRNSFEWFNEEKLSARKYFYSSTKDGKIGDDGKISDGHISVKDYLTCEKTWYENKLIWNEKYGWLSRSYLKKRCIVISWSFWKVYCYVFKILSTWSLLLF